MNIEVEQLTTSELKNLLPLNHSGEIQYSYVIQAVDEPYILNTILAFVREPFKYLPFYFFLDISNFLERFKFECEKHDLLYEDFGQFRKSHFVILSIKDEAALTAIFPVIRLMMIAEDFVMWSSNKDSLKWMNEVSFKYNFSRYPPIAILLEKPTTIFWTIECGRSLLLCSNENQFRSSIDIEQNFKLF